MKSVPSLLFFKPMKEEPPEWVQVFGWSIFTPDGHISGRGVDKGLPCEMAFKLPYLPGEKCRDKSTGKVVTILSCGPMRVSEVTKEDAVRAGMTLQIRHQLGWSSNDAGEEEFNFYLAADTFIKWWRNRHPCKSWAWRVEGKEERLYPNVAAYVTNPDEYTRKKKALSEVPDGN